MVNSLLAGWYKVPLFIPLHPDTFQTLHAFFPLGKIRWIGISKWRLSRSMVIRNPDVKCYLDALDSIHHQKAQLTVDEVVCPYFIQCCAGNIVVAYDTLMVKGCR